MLKKFKCLKAHVLTILVSIFILVSLALSISLTTPPGRLTVDGATLAVMAEAPFKNLGVPYKDYWEFKPPGIMLLIGLWGRMFNFSLFSYQLLQILSFLSIGFLSYSILKKVFLPTVALIVTTLHTILLYSPNFKTGFLVAETYGLLFSLIGLTTIFYIQNVHRRFFISAFFLTFASQLKDPFIFTPLALFPYVAVLVFSSSTFRQKITSLFWMIAGVGTAALLVIAYLLLTGAVKDYLKVKHVESFFFGNGLLTNPQLVWVKLQFSVQQIQNTLLTLHFPSKLILLILLFSLITVYKSKKRTTSGLRFTIFRKYYSFVLFIPKTEASANSRSLKVFSLIFYSAGSLLGFTLQGKFDFHHLVQITFPLYFLITLLTNSTMHRLTQVLQILRFSPVLSSLVLIIFLLPQKSFLEGYNPSGLTIPQAIARSIQNTLPPPPVTTFEDYIASKTNKEACILSVYGWGVSPNYYYTQRRPCTRYFLTDTVGSDSQALEYRDSLFNHPPQAIIYSVDNGERSGKFFNKKVVDIPRLLKNCYQKDIIHPDPAKADTVLYLPIARDNELKRCIKENAEWKEDITL